MNLTYRNSRNNGSVVVQVFDEERRLGTIFGGKSMGWYFRSFYGRHDASLRSKPMATIEEVKTWLSKQEIK